MKIYKVVYLGIYPNGTTAFHMENMVLTPVDAQKIVVLYEEQMKRDIEHPAADKSIDRYIQVVEYKDSILDGIVRLLYNRSGIISSCEGGMTEIKRRKLFFMCSGD